MKVGFALAPLITAMTKVGRLIPSSKSVPILQYVRLEAEDGLVRFTSTDLVNSMTLTLTTGVKVAEPGAVLLPWQKVVDSLRLSNGKTAAFVYESGVLKVVSGTTTWKPDTRDVTDFPEVAEVLATEVHTLPRADLLAAVQRVRTAAARDTFSVSLEQVGIRNGKIQAADNIRYHEVSLPQAANLDIALPLDFLTELVGMLTGSTAETIDLGVSADRKSVVVSHSDTVLSSAVKTEKFPNVAHALLIPAMSHDIELKVSRTALRGAVQRVRTMADPSTKAIRLRLQANVYDFMEVSAQQPTGAWAGEKVAVNWGGDEGRVLVFNHEYFSQLLALFEHDDLTLKMRADAKHKPSSVLIQAPDRAGVLLQLKMDWR